MSHWVLQEGEASGKLAGHQLRIPDILAGSTPNPTQTPKVCKIMTFVAIINGSGPLFYMLWGFR